MYICTYIHACPQTHKKTISEIFTLKHLLKTAGEWKMLEEEEEKEGKTQEEEADEGGANEEVKKEI